MAQASDLRQVSPEEFDDMARPVPSLRAFLTLLCLLTCLSSPLQAEEAPPPETVIGRWPAELVPKLGHLRDLGTGEWHYGAYLDLGYNEDFNQPENGQWRSKNTTFEVNDPRVNMVMGYLRKNATTDSRWGLEFGVQGGIDTDKLVPQPPPPANEPISGADQLRHFYRANVSYLLPAGNGLRLTGGLINSYIGYESFHAIDNPNYTRGYLLDNVPYFLFGAEADYQVSDRLQLGLFVVNGYDYLADPNDLPSYGLHAEWRHSPRLTFVQNFYYGPDQGNTAVQFWRFFSDSILAWKSDRFLLAIAYDVGTEKQAAQPGHPRFVWMASALWAGWHIGGPWSLAARPEFYWDPQGLITGADQLIQAYTATLEYKLTLLTFTTGVVKLEYRYDRSTGSGGGFYTGFDNRLTPDQHQLILGLMWAFGS